MSPPWAFACVTRITLDIEQQYNTINTIQIIYFIDFHSRNIGYISLLSKNMSALSDFTPFLMDGQTESDAYEPTMQIAHVGSKRWSKFDIQIWSVD